MTGREEANRLAQEEYPDRVAVTALLGTTHAQGVFIDRAPERIAYRNGYLAGRKSLLGLLREDASGRPLPELLTVVASVLNSHGGGPLVDCLRLRAEELAAAIREMEEA